MIKKCVALTSFLMLTVQPLKTFSDSPTVETCDDNPGLSHPTPCLISKGAPCSQTGPSCGACRDTVAIVARKSCLRSQGSEDVAYLAQSSSIWHQSQDTDSGVSVGEWMPSGSQALTTGTGQSGGTSGVAAI